PPSRWPRRSRIGPRASSPPAKGTLKPLTSRACILPFPTPMSEPAEKTATDEASPSPEEAKEPVVEEKSEPKPIETKAEEKKKEDDTPDVVPRGNPLQYKRGIIAILAGAVPAFLLMAKNGQNQWGIPLGCLCILVAAWGVMDLLGTFEDPEDRIEKKLTM